MSATASWPRSKRSRSKLSRFSIRSSLSCSTGGISTPTSTPSPGSASQDSSRKTRWTKCGKTGWSGTRASSQIPSPKSRKSFTKSTLPASTDTAGSISRAAPSSSLGWNTTSRASPPPTRTSGTCFTWSKREWLWPSKQVILHFYIETYQLSVIYDRRDMAESDDVSKESMKKFMPILNDYYPETLKSFYVLGANVLYRAAWKVVSIFISKRTE